jgi:hypothetical protein
LFIDLPFSYFVGTSDEPLGEVLLSCVPVLCDAVDAIGSHEILTGLTEVLLVVVVLVLVFLLVMLLLLLLLLLFLLAQRLSTHF